MTKLAVDLRERCVNQGPDEAARLAERLDLDVDEVMTLLRPPTEGLGPGHHQLETADAAGITVPTTVYVPSKRRRGDLGALLALHGAGSDGATFVRKMEPIAEACGVALICPTASTQRDGERNLDLSGLFGRRFAGSRWTYGPADVAMAALRQGSRALGVAAGRTAMFGTSMGGIAVWNLAMRRWWETAAAFVVNGAPSMWERFGPDDTIDQLMANLAPVPLTIVHGVKDAQIPCAMAEEGARRALLAGAPDVTFIAVPHGEHAWDSMDLVPQTPQFEAIVARILQTPARPTWPRMLTHRAVNDDHGRVHWVSLTGIEPNQPAEVRAEVVGPRTITVQSRGARLLQLSLSQELVTPGPVHLVVNGHSHAITFRPSVSDLLRSYADESGGPLSTCHVEIDLDPTERGNK